MADVVIVDTGPLVALLHRQDQHHHTCCEILATLRPPLLTTWLAMTEAAWLLRNLPDGPDRLLQLLDSGLVRCYPIEDAAASRMRELLAEYRDLRPQLTDLSLVYLAEKLHTDQIFTLDRRDFTVFRTPSGNPFRLLPAAN